MKTIIKVLFDKEVVGTIQSVLLNESPYIDPNNGQKLHISRIRFDRLKTGELFSRGFVHHNAQKMPFQIVIEENGKDIFTMHNVWIEAPTDSEKQYTYQTEQWIIAEGISMVCEFVSGSFEFSSENF